MKYYLFCLLTLYNLVYAQPINTQTLSDESRVIRSFYKKYLNHLKTRYTNNLAPSFSTSFNALIKKDRDACEKRKTTDICGYNVHKDIYLGTQEIAPNLNFNNSSFTLSNPHRGLVIVTFNVYSLTTKTIQFKMIQENGQWVVDDILYSDSTSLRRQITTEIADINR